MPSLLRVRSGEALLGRRRPRAAHRQLTHYLASRVDGGVEEVQRTRSFDVTPYQTGGSL